MAALILVGFLFYREMGRWKGESFMGIEAVVRSVGRDPIFDIEVAKFNSVDGSLQLALELPKELVILKKGRKAMIDLRSEPQDGDLVMKGVVYRIDDIKRKVEISFHGLWMRISYKKENPFNLEEGKKIYLSIKFIK